VFEEAGEYKIMPASSSNTRSVDIALLPTVVGSKNGFAGMRRAACAPFF
jgi:hypothetical protein